MLVITRIGYTDLGRYRRINPGRSLNDRVSIALVGCFRWCTARRNVQKRGHDREVLIKAWVPQVISAKLHLTAAMSLPPFPEDVPTHPLLVVDYQKLVEDDAGEIETFWQAATTLGFW